MAVNPDLSAFSVMPGHLEVLKDLMNGITFSPEAQDPFCHLLVLFKASG